ncbi:hypothetical protein GCM10025868_42430 [Angustibacter aerolatus]|uniref:ABC transporter permease n=1 Tax=Angustibacter aerolatus TaxID=1162965 RepID=A0ABQ6JLA1_9ACTN|nr:hypothetical protein [Angustibacter aerolatus]GMA88993.1 hypothetical protein GCM10025868_42430 [Angustibacter aerolatus]
MATATPTRPAASSAASRSRTDAVRPFATLAGMVVVLAAVAVARPLFLRLDNLSAVAVDATVLVVMAVGLSVLMAMRGLDLSIAATADLAGYLAAKALLDGHGTTAAVLAALAIGLLVGLVNGALSAYVGLPAIVATLGTNLLVTAVALVVSDSGTPQQPVHRAHRAS